MTKSMTKILALGAMLSVSMVSGAAFAGNPTDFGPYQGQMRSSHAGCGEAGQVACSFGTLKFGGDNVGPYKADATASLVREDAGCGNRGEPGCSLGTLKFGGDNVGPYGAN